MRRTSSGRRRSVKIGDAATRTAVKGQTALRVRDGRRARALLRGRRRVKAELIVKVRSRYGRLQVVKQTVTLVGSRG